MRIVFALLLIALWALYAEFMVEKYPLYAASPYGLKSLVLWWSNFVGVTSGIFVVVIHLFHPRKYRG